MAMLRRLLLSAVMVLAGWPVDAQTVDCTPVRLSPPAHAEADNEGYAHTDPVPAGEMWIVKIVEAQSDIAAAGVLAGIYLQAKSEPNTIALTPLLQSCRGEANHCSFLPREKFLLESGESIGLTGLGLIKLDVLGWKVPTACRGKALGLVP